MTNGNIWELYRGIWCRVKDEYGTGFCWSERGLQAALYAELRKLKGVNVLVEPTWGKARPDLVLVRDRQITDIFELKFSPHTKYKSTWEATNEGSDIRKLRKYIGKEYPVSLVHGTGQWDNSHCLPVNGDCRLHFVAVARHNADLQWPLIPAGVTRWRGCTGEAYPDEWYIEL